jgi:hypothetical protein
MLTSAPDVLLVKNAKKEIFVLKISLSTLLKSRLQKFQDIFAIFSFLNQYPGGGALFSIFLMILEVQITKINVFNIIILIFLFKQKLKVYNYYSYLEYGRKFTNG